MKETSGIKWFNQILHNLMILMYKIYFFSLFSVSFLVRHIFKKVKNACPIYPVLCRFLSNKITSLHYSLVANGTLHNSVIFPKCSIAFLVQPLCEMTTTWPPRGKYFLDTESLERYSFGMSYCFFVTKQFRKFKIFVILLVDCNLKILFHLF